MFCNSQLLNNIGKHRHITTDDRALILGLQ